MPHHDTTIAVPSSTGPAETRAASIRDRLAANVLDLALCTLLFFGAADAIVRDRGALAISTYAGSLHPSRATMTAVVFAGIVLLYFFVSEGITGTTPGKRLCGLAVKRSGRQRPCGLIGAFVRTLVRPLDLLVGLPLILSSKARQRFGDRIADTSVVDVRNVVPPGPAGATAVATATVAGWEARTKAVILDLTLLGAAVAALLYAVGAVDTQGGLRVTLHPALTITAAAAILLCYAAAAGGTPGQRAAGLAVVHDDGTRCGFAASTLRTVSRPFDLGTLGVVSFILLRTSRRSFGDVIAATRVVPSARRADARSQGTSRSAVLRTPLALLLAAAAATAIGAAAGVHGSPATLEQSAAGGTADDGDVRALGPHVPHSPFETA